MHYGTKPTMYFLNFVQEVIYKSKQICLTQNVKLHCGFVIL